MMNVQSSPAATCFTFSSAIDATAVGRYRATSSPCPSRPPALQPHDHRAPFTVIATEWKGPEHTLLTGSMATRRGTSLTQGTLPDGPSPNWPCRWCGLVGYARQLGLGPRTVGVGGRPALTRSFCPNEKTDPASVNTSECAWPTETDTARCVAGSEMTCGTTKSVPLPQLHTWPSVSTTMP